MRSFALFLALFFVSAPGFAQDCSFLNGLYRKVSSNDLNLDLRFDPATRILVFYYERDDGRTQRDEYTVDGLEHQGDGKLKGDRYTARCQDRVLYMTRVYKAGVLSNRFVADENGVILEYARLAGFPEKLRNRFEKRGD